MKLKTKVDRMLQNTMLHSKYRTQLSLIVVLLFFFTAMKWYGSHSAALFHHSSLNLNGVRTAESALAVFVLSKREAFDRRERIRKTWALGHDNVFFVVGAQYCPYPSENRVLDTCTQNNYSLNREKLKPYLDTADRTTRKILDETDVILVPTGDDVSELPRKVTESYSVALRSLQADWFLHVEDTVDVEVDKLENYLKTAFAHSAESTIILSVIKASSESRRQNGNKPAFVGHMCSLNHVVSRCVAQYAVRSSSTLFQYIDRHNIYEMQIADSIKITSENYGNLDFIAKDDCNMTHTLQLNIALKQSLVSSCLDSNSVETLTSRNERDILYSLFENPSTYLHSDRFDLIVKMVYAYFYVFKNRVPNAIKDAYIQHIKVWNNFNENCKNLEEVWYDAKGPCEEKRSSLDFISTFHNTIDNIMKSGFNSSLSRIPIDKSGFLLNGAHRLAALVVLSKYATFEHQNYKMPSSWGYKYFKGLGLSVNTFDLAMLEWMKIQMQLPYIRTLVSIVSVFSNNHGKDETMRKIVMKGCSKDNGILYEKSINITLNGARQLITHMYGKQSWLRTKIQQMVSKFELSTFRVLFLFIYGKEQNDLVHCKDEIRKLYNDKIFKSTVHIPDTSEENLILAEMILNPNSVQFMNHGKDPQDCKHIASEIARRSSTPSIKTLPTIHLGRDDVMVDSGAVLGFFGLRQRTDVDILFLKDVYKSILGNRHGLTIQAHAFKFNSISRERAWGEDHFSETGPKDQWDLFYDPKNYGYCYGIKFVSLQQLIRYKIKRNEPNKDQYDVGLIKELLKTIAPNSCPKSIRFSYQLFCICFILFAIVLLLE